MVSKNKKRKPVSFVKLIIRIIYLLHYSQSIVILITFYYNHDFSKIEIIVHPQGQPHPLHLEYTRFHPVCRRGIEVNLEFRQPPDFQCIFL